MNAASLSPASLTRRAALAGLGAGGLGLTLAPSAHAQDSTIAALASHPVVGAWRVVPDPPGPPVVLIVYHADGTLVYSVPASAPAPPGSSSKLVYSSSAYGVWEPTGERAVALSAALIETDETGAFLDTLSFHGTVEVDATGDAYRFVGVVEATDSTGAVTQLGPASTRGTRIAVDREKAAATPTP